MNRRQVLFLPVAAMALRIHPPGQSESQFTWFDLGNDWYMEVDPQVGAYLSGVVKNDTFYGVEATALFTLQDARENDIDAWLGLWNQGHRLANELQFMIQRYGDGWRFLVPRDHPNAVRPPNEIALGSWHDGVVTHPSGYEEVMDLGKFLDLAVEAHEDEQGTLNPKAEGSIPSGGTGDGTIAPGRAS